MTSVFDLISVTAFFEAMSGRGGFADDLGAATTRTERRIGSRAEVCGLSSFSPSTRVLLKDGRTKAIVAVRPGDEVESADPGDGRHSGPRTVEARLVHHDEDLVDVTVRTSDHRRQVVHTTSRHPFWDGTVRRWVPAGELVPGHSLETAAGGHVTVLAVHPLAGAADMYNLTVDQLHTYYVLAGSTPVLVHNTGCDTYSAFYEGGGGVMADLNDGALTMVIEKGAGSPSGGRMFADVMNHFGAENVTSFQAKWVSAMPSNLDAFNANLRAGMSYEEAAASTFTGHMLAKYGLTDVTVDQSRLAGGFGNYTNVEPVFSRPGG